MRAQKTPFLRFFLRVEPHKTHAPDAPPLSVCLRIISNLRRTMIQEDFLSIFVAVRPSSSRKLLAEA
jgi:hypothetical protein